MFIGRKEFKLILLVIERAVLLEELAQSEQARLVEAMVEEAGVSKLKYLYQNAQVDKAV